jgi:hypothetical protein
MMTYCLFFLVLTLSTFSINSNKTQTLQEKEILPFSSIKIEHDNIIITLDTARKEWHKLLSVDNVGSDAIIKFAKDHYGVSKCDFEIECYKYNIIVNFGKVFALLQEKPLPDKIGVEYELNNKKQNGVDVECTKEKYEINKKNIAVNIKFSKNKPLIKPIFPALSGKDSIIFKGINKNKNGLGNVFNDKHKEKNEKEKEGNLRKELSDIKNNIKNIKNDEEEIKKIENVKY